MSNDKLFNVSKVYMLYCIINGWGVLMERREEPDRRYLDSITRLGQPVIHGEYYGFDQTADIINHDCHLSSP